MKKLNTRYILFTFLIFFSLSSYIYINSLKIEPVSEVQTLHQSELETEKKQKEHLLPDVELVKSLLERSRGFLPAS